MSGKHHSEETKQLIQNKVKGYKHSDDAKRKMRKSRVGKTPAKGMKHSEETKLILGEKSAKEYIIYFKDGTKEEIKNKSKWCRENKDRLKTVEKFVIKENL